MKLRATCIWLSVSLILAVALPARPLSAQTPARYAEAPAPTHYAAPIKFAHTLIEAVMDESGTPGVSLAIGIAGEIVWSEGFGYADVEHRVPVWEETRFRIGSVSKPLTAAALGLLYEQGRLDLDAPVQSYVPSFPEKRWPITTRQLAGHLAGIRHYRDEEFLSSERYDSVLDGLEIFQDDTLLFEPATRYSYSSYGWNLISAVVEGASNQPFLAYMQASVFEPLGMKHTVADHVDSIIPHRTRFYTRTADGHVVNAPFVDNSYKWAGGGFLSTPEDLVRFGLAHLDGQFVAPETVEMMWTSQHTNDGDETNYGIGWGVRAEDGRVTRAAHGGGSIGGTTYLLIRPEEGAVLAIVGNLSQAPTFALAEPILEAFLEPETLASETEGPDISGTYTCSATAQGETILSGTFQIAGSPAAYWGRTRWSDDSSDRIIFSSTHADEVRLVTIGYAGRLADIRVTDISAAGFSGRWSGGELTCEIKN